MTRKNIRSKKPENADDDDINNNDLFNEEFEELAEEDFYNVERIVEKKIINGTNKYLIKWEGYPESQNTWEPLDNLLSVVEMVDEFENSLREKEKEKYSLDIISTGKNDSGNKQDDLNVYKPKKANLLPNDDEEETYSDLSKTRKLKKIVQENEEINLFGKIHDEYQKDQDLDLEEHNKEMDFEDNGKDQSNINIERRFNEDKPIDKNIKSDKKIENFLNKNHDKKEIKGRPKKRLLPLEGHFKYRDKPKEIVSVKMEKNNSLRFKVSWYQRPDGIIPIETSFTNDQLREYDPLFLLDFYESKIVLCSKKRKSNSESLNPEEELNLNQSKVISVDEREKDHIEFLPKPNEHVPQEESRALLNEINPLPIDNSVLLEDDQNISRNQLNETNTIPIDKTVLLEEEQQYNNNTSRNLLNETSPIPIEKTVLFEEEQQYNNTSEKILNNDKRMNIQKDYEDKPKDISIEDVALDDESLNPIKSNIPTETFA